VEKLMCKPKWLDIATAPRDESWLLLYADIFGEPSVHAGFWSEGDWYDSEAASKPLRDVWAEPTHWQRFSAPTYQPAEEAQEAENGYCCPSCGRMYGSGRPVIAEAPATAPQSAGDVFSDSWNLQDLCSVNVDPPDLCTLDLQAILRDKRPRALTFGERNSLAIILRERLRPSPAAAISEGERMSEARRNAYIRGFQRGHDAFLNNNSHEHVRALAEAYAISYAEQFDDSARLSPDKETAR
jgi:hypothetical protein